MKLTEGVAGLKEHAMHTATPSFVGFAKALRNKDRLIGQKRPLRPGEVELVRLRINDICVGSRVLDRATIIQQKTGGPAH